MDVKTNKNGLTQAEEKALSEFLRQRKSATKTPKLNKKEVHKKEKKCLHRSTATNMVWHYWGLTESSINICNHNQQHQLYLASVQVLLLVIVPTKIFNRYIKPIRINAFPFLKKIILYNPKKQSTVRVHNVSFFLID